MAYHPLRAAPNSGEIGDLYAVHLRTPYRHAVHYQGWVRTLPGESEWIEVNGIKIEVTPAVRGRLAEHGTRAGAKMLEFARGAGCEWDLCWTGRGDRNEERRLKNQGGASIRERCAYCPDPR
jgi:hypothetical protein